jgi:hypothetical protein
MLSRISKLTIEFCALKTNSRSAKEFLARATTAKSVASNPECQVDVRLVDGGEPFVEVVFTNKLSDKVMTGDLTAPQIVEKIQERSQAMEADEILKKVGLSKAKLEVTPGMERYQTGVQTRVPIT